MTEYTCVSITSLNKKKYKIDLEGMEMVTLSLYPSEIRKYKIEEGCIISHSIFMEIMEVLYKRGKERALYYLKTSDKTSAQMKKKLKESYYPLGVIDRILDFLIKYGYIDDVRYTENYISYNRKNKSIISMSKALSDKGIDREIINKVLDECEYDMEEQQEAAIYVYCNKKVKPDMSDADYEKLMLGLLRKGFKYETIKSIVGRFKEEQNNFLGNF